ncbi:MAG: DNA polymerase I [Anaerolineales bacterium]|nr:DNA polymerase I [Anaerolineales bacterium]
MPPTLYLIDGHALAYRTYFALTRGGSGFTTSTGEPTAGVFGFVSVLLRILEQDRPDFLAVAFDTGKTFRDDLFPDYKGTRAKMPDDLRPQIERIRQVVDVFNIPRLEVENYEADDVLGSVARQAVDQGYGVKIITGDRDLLQLVEDRIIVNLPGKSLSDARDFMPEDVKVYLGVRPDQVVDFKALVGDKSDNIPGVVGIGKKTATSLLASYNDLDGVYSHLEDLSPSVKKKLEVGRDNALLSKELAMIVTDLQVPLDLEQARPQHIDPAQVEALFRELEFRSLMTRLSALMKTYGIGPTDEGQQLSLFGGQEHPATSSASEVQTSIVDSPDALRELVDLLSSAQVVAFDTETTSTDQMSAELVGISLSVDGEYGYYIPVGHLPDLGKQLPVDIVIEALKEPLTDSHLQKVGHNLKYDYILLARYGLRVNPLSFDTMIAEWLINPTSRNLGLKNLAWVRLNAHMTSIEELIGKGKKQISMADVPIAQAADYAGVDAAIVLQLMPQLRSELEERHAMNLFEEIEMPLVTVLADMEMAGIALDTQFLAEMSADLGTRLGEIETQVYQSVGEPFNLNSPQQLSRVLFDRLQITPPDRTRRTSSGYYSTAVGVLEALRGKHPVVDWVLEYRELSKLKSTYVDALPLQINPTTGRVHTSYNQTGSVTGRIASSNPNLQNIPIRTELGRRVRRGFVADPGFRLLAVDYSQVELRIVAHMAGDEAMLAAFRAGQDIHATTAAAIYNVTLENVTKEQRRHAKAVNFGLIYGMSAFGLMRTTDLTLAEAEEFVDSYFRQFPAIKSYLDDTRRQAADQGYVETLLTRRRYFPGLKNQSNHNIRNREEREAINAPIQGTAADIMKIAMLRVPIALKEAGLSASMLLQVHDELVLECPEDELNPTAALVQKVMENAYTLSIPLVTEARSGYNWGEMLPVGL